MAAPLLVQMEDDIDRHERLLEERRVLQESLARQDNLPEGQVRATHLLLVFSIVIIIVHINILLIALLLFVIVIFAYCACSWLLSSINVS
jgi:hypothetical protein